MSKPLWTKLSLYANHAPSQCLVNVALASSLVMTALAMVLSSAQADVDCIAEAGETKAKLGSSQFQLLLPAA